MAKLESSFRNMVVSLVTISMVASAVLAGAYIMTKDKIDEQKKQKEEKAILEVLPNKGAGVFTVEAKHEEGAKQIVYRAYSEKDSTYVGAAVKSIGNGFGGEFTIMIGFDADTVIVNYDVLEHKETPGLGDNMGKWFKNNEKAGQNIIGRKATNFVVTKEGSKNESEVDAITAATISSDAFITAVNDAYMALKSDKEEHQKGNGGTK